MKKYELKFYDSNVEVYEFTKDEALRAEIHIDGPIQNPVEILKDGEYLEGSRHLDSYYARGFADDKDIYILADRINTKQLANIFSLLEAHSAIAAVYDLDKVSIYKMTEEEIIFEDTNEGGSLLIGDAGTIVTGTISMDELLRTDNKKEMSEHKPKKKKHK